MNLNQLETRKAINKDIISYLLFHKLLNKKLISLRNFDPI